MATGKITRATVLVTKKETVQVWTGFCDTQAIRFDPELNQFQWCEDIHFPDWEPVEWKWFLGSDENPIDKKEITETLQMLLKLIKNSK